MQNLVAGLLAQISPKTREQAALRAELDAIIDRLERQQQRLAHRLTTETRGAKRRRLRITLEVGRLQLKKALVLRTNLSAP